MIDEVKGKEIEWKGKLLYELNRLKRLNELIKVTRLGKKE